MNETYADEATLSPASQRSGAQSEEDSSETLSLDERFEILKNERRRLVLQLLKEWGETSKLNHLADRVTAIENETEVDAITSEQRKRVYVALYQFHLPKMEKMDVIEYDQDRGDVALAEAGERLYREYSAEDDEWSGRRAFLGVGFVGVGGVITSLLFQSWVVSAGLLTVQTLLLLLVFCLGHPDPGSLLRW